MDSSPIWKEVQARIPKWLSVSLRAAIKSHAQPRFDVVAKLALVEIKPDRLREISDDDLGAVWLRLHQWFSNAKEEKQAVENIVNAALWVKAEMERRGHQVGPSELVDLVTDLESVRKERAASVHGVEGKTPELIGKILASVPDEVLVVRDFVAIAGSAAVTEKPNDLDVVIRAEYDPRLGKYLLDGSYLGVVLRRFFAPKKGSGPQVQLLGSPQGSFTDYIPVFDLVVRKRKPQVVRIEPEPPAYEGQDRVIKAATAAMVEDAETAKRTDTLIPGHYFFQPKPTRPAEPEQPQSLDSLVQLFHARAAQWLPTWIQKKFDGANHQIHKLGDRVLIFSEDGDNNSDRLPQLVQEIQKLPVENAVLAAEIEMWDGDQHFPREAVAGYLSGKDQPDDSSLVANVYDVLYWDKDIHKEPLKTRLEYLGKLGKGTLGAPDLDKRINVAEGMEAKTAAQVQAITDRFRKLPGSEGMVAKRLDSPYPLDQVTLDTWIKFHNSTPIKAQILKGYRTKGGVFTYDYGVRAGSERPRFITPGRLVPVGETFSTAQRFRPGDRVLIEAESVNKIKGPDGVEITAWVPRVLGTFQGDVDTVDNVVQRAAENLVLQVKVINDKGQVLEYLKPNVIKTLKPEVPTQGPNNAILAFIGASPGRTEAARAEPFVGPAGETFNEVYLKPLGLRRDQVLITNAVPRLLVDENGKVREPTVEEIKEWKDWLKGELERKAPRILVALGRTAESALGNADFVLPHPSAVRRFGDSGEVGRKLKQIANRIKREKEVFSSILNDLCPVCRVPIISRCRCSGPHTYEQMKMGHGLRCANGHISSHGLALDRNGEKILLKQIPDPLSGPREDETRGTVAADNWEENWFKMLPTSGRGRFAYQHHWRGLSEEETKLDEKALMATDHSVHGDIRLEGNGSLWGFAVLLGRASDNRNRKEMDKLIGWKPGDAIELAPKVDQPLEWLDVGKGKPLITGPGEVGATSEKYSKFFGIDSGTYHLGVARQHMVEIFLDGKYLSGRFILTYAPVAGRRRWLIEKPENQTPMAEQRDPTDVMGEIKRKGQKFLIWSKPGMKPMTYDVRTGQEIKKYGVPILKADTLKRVVFGVVMDPYGDRGPEPDAHKDWTPPGVIEEAAHQFLLGSRFIGLEHQKKADAQVVESWVEQYPTREDYLAAMKGLPHRVFRKKFGDETIHSGAWMLGVKLGPEAWEAFEKGEINNFSPGGIGLRTPITENQFPQVEFIDLVENGVKP